MSVPFVAGEFIAAVEHVAVTALKSGRCALAARDVYALAEKRHSEISDTSHVACGPGCDACCVVNVSVLAPEADVIAGYLKLTLEPEALSDISLKLKALDQHTRWLDDEERIMSNHCCAFLNGDGRCQIYPVRPLLCRSITSTNADDCSAAMSMLAFGENLPITSCLVQKEIFEAAFIGLGQALKACGLDDRSLRLTGAVLKRLENKA